MEDYASNSKSQKEGVEAEVARPPKDVQKVVSGEVKTKKRGLGARVKDVVVMADIKSVLRHVGWEILLPAAKNMIYDGAVSVVDRTMFPNGSGRRGYGGYPSGPSTGPRVTYNNPINRSYRDIRDAASRPGPPSGPRSRPIFEDVVLSSRHEAETVLERMNDILDNYELVSVADLYELCGLPGSHTDNKWGWVGLVGSSVRQIRDGYVLELPAPEPIQ